MISKTRARKVIKELAELKETVENRELHLEEENKILSDEIKILKDKVSKLELDIKKIKEK